MSVRDSWEVIHDWLRRKYPSMLNLLNGPAGAAELDRLEKQLARRLPDDFKESYRIHNGSDGNSGCLVGLTLMALSEIERVWQMWAEIADENNKDLDSACKSSPDGAVKILYANRGWLPFAGDSQNHVAVDFDPDFKGTPGQIINCGRDDELRHVIAEDFRGFLAFAAWLFAHDKVAARSNDPPDQPRWLCVKGSGDDLLTGLPALLAEYRTSPDGQAEQFMPITR